MDIALQHISDNMLKLMRRPVSKEDTYKLIEQFRKEVPGIHLRAGFFRTIRLQDDKPSDRDR